MRCPFQLKPVKKVPDYVIAVMKKTKENAETTNKIQVFDSKKNVLSVKKQRKTECRFKRERLGRSNIQHKAYTHIIGAITIAIFTTNQIRIKRNERECMNNCAGERHAKK